MSTGTRAGLNQLHISRAEQARTGSRMALATASFAGGRAPFALGLFERRIRRRGLTGGLRGFLHAPLEGVDLFLELLDALFQALQIYWDSNPDGDGDVCKRQHQAR